MPVVLNFDRVKNMSVERKHVVSKGNFSQLSKRDFEVSALVGLGCSNKDIASALGIGEGTVKVYLSRIFDKLKLPDRAFLATMVNSRCREFALAKRRIDEKYNKLRKKSQ